MPYIHQGSKNKFKFLPLRTVYVFYWFLLAYIFAILIFWFLALDRQNKDLANFKSDMISIHDAQRVQKINSITSDRERKTNQYLGEGITSLLLIAAGAVFVFKIVDRQLVQSRQQQNFMMAITHELKTPIAVTKLNLETMQKRKLEYDLQQKLIRSTIQEANRLNALCNNMFLLSQIDAGGYTITSEELDLGMLANDCTNDFIIRFPNRIIETSFDEEGELNILGDKLLLQLAINNLLDNAIKYSGKEDLVLLKVFRDNKWIKLQVIDEGDGIIPEESGKIFEKYFRGVQRQMKGTGLGLYLTKEIVKQHHGDISMTNNIPDGCIFEIRLKSARKP